MIFVQYELFNYYYACIQLQLSIRFQRLISITEALVVQDSEKCVIPRYIFSLGRLPRCPPTLLILPFIRTSSNVPTHTYCILVHPTQSPKQLLCYVVSYHTRAISNYGIVACSRAIVLLGILLLNATLMLMIRITPNQGIDYLKYYTGWVSSLSIAWQ